MKRMKTMMNRIRRNPITFKFFTKKPKFKKLIKLKVLLCTKSLIFLPSTGLIKNGFWFGSFYPSPTGLLSASDLLRNSKLTRIFPFSLSVSLVCNNWNSVSGCW